MLYTPKYLGKGSLKSTDAHKECNVPQYLRSRQ